MTLQEAKKALRQEIKQLEEIEAEHFRPDDLREDLVEPVRRLTVLEMNHPELFTAEITAKIEALKHAVTSREPPPGYVVPGKPLHELYDIPENDVDKSRFWG